MARQACAGPQGKENASNEKAKIEGFSAPIPGLVQSQAMAGDKLWVAGVELAERASPRCRPRSGGVELRSPTRDTWATRI